MLRRYALILALISIVTTFAFTQTDNRVTSPDGNIAFTLTPSADSLRYSISYRGKPVITNAQLGLELQGLPAFGPGMKQIGSKPGSGDETYRVVASKSNPITSKYNSLTAEFMGLNRDRRLNIEARVFDDGVAFRYVLPEQMWLTEARILRELTQFTFAKDAVTYPLVLQGFISSYEDEYQKRQLTGLPPKWLVALPLLAELPGTAWVAIAEANIDNYAGMYLRRDPKTDLTFTATLAPRIDDQDMAVIAPVPLNTPWRVIMIGSEPGRLVESNILFNLNPPSAIADTSWIKPGKTLWDWWSGNFARDVSFKPGINTETEKHYIDFASESGIPYMLVDEGWAAPAVKGLPADITHTAPAIDMPELLRYAKEKNVRLWLWAHWTSVDKFMDEAFPLFEKWGVAGVKIDFMDRDDQQMVGFYHRVLKNAAAHHLMIDFHGAYKPDGSERTYPNMLTREGVMGLEYTKWTGRITPIHNCTLPFTRMLAGPLDYTPGGFLNVAREEFTPRVTEPMVMGTRAHQLALYVVFQSGFQMLSDYPERYKGQRDFEFIRNVPVTWDETRVLKGQPMEFISIARRNGNEWFIGSITDWNQRDLEIPLTFLANGKYQAEIYADAADAATQPTHTAISTQTVDRTTTLKLHLVSGGGNAIRIRPMQK